MTEPANKPRLPLDEILRRIATAGQQVEDAAAKYGPAATAAETAKKRLDEGVCVGCGGERLHPAPLCAACARAGGIKLIDVFLSRLVSRGDK